MRAMETNPDTRGSIVGEIAAAAAAAAAAGRRCAIAVSPSVLDEAVVAALAAQGEFRHPVHVFLADTRFDAGGRDPAEARALLRALPVPRGQLHADVADLADPARAAAAYEQELRAFFGLAVGGLPRFDAVVLRIARCGNLPGLHGGSEALDETSRIVAVNRAQDGARFVTLTPPVIRSAGRVLVAACPESAARRPSQGVAGRLIAAPNATLLLH